MTMTNAQAALIAASNSAVRGSAVPVEPVLRRAAAFLLWLDSQEEPAPEAVAVSQRHYNEQHKPESIVQCTAASANYTRCLLASGHKGDHRNSTEGEYWSTTATYVPEPRPVHFVTEPGAPSAVCGISTAITEAGKRLVTTSFDRLTCDTCKEELGL